MSRLLSEIFGDSNHTTDIDSPAYLLFQLLLLEQQLVLRTFVLASRQVSNSPVLVR
jgi:hypothetical protein